MGDAVIGVLIVFAVMMLLVVVAMAESIRRLRRASRLSPRVDTGAPLGWLVSPSAPARLHRRLQGAVALADAVRTSTPTGRIRRRRRPAQPLTATGEMAQRLERQAATVSSQLVLMARLRGGARRRALDPARRDVAEIERLAVRLAALARPQDDQVARVRLADEVEALHAAYAELAAMEAPVVVHPAR